jgi:hypothetical protein
MAAAHARMPRPFEALRWPPCIDWGRGLVQGMVMGVLPLVVDLPLPTLVATIGAPATAAYLSGQLLLGTCRGAVWAWTAQWVEGRLAWPVIALLFIGETTLLVALSLAVRESVGGPFRAFVFDADFVMLLWLSLAYGGVFFAYCLATQRALRVRGVLARAELERERSATALNEARLDAMAMRVDPVLLLRALTAARQAYERQRDGADSLLDDLVTFLRLAMPAVRSGRSTLSSELALLRAHAALRGRIEPGATSCTVMAESPVRDIAFPPLLLIPLIEAAAAQGDRAPHVALTSGPSWLQLTVEAATPPAWMDDTTAQRLERALRSLYDSPGARFEVGASPSLTLWLPMPPTPEEFAHEAATA